jgi:hypothetical protein
MLAGAIVVAVLAIAVLGWGPEIEPSPTVRPSAAVQFAIYSGLARGKVYNSYDFGGYLIERGIPTFMDGRGVVFGKLFDEYFDGSKYPAMFDRADWLLIKTPGFILPPPGFKLTYRDQYAVIYEKETQAGLPPAVE